MISRFAGSAQHDDVLNTQSMRRMAGIEYRTMSTDSLAEAAISDTELVLQFESLGDSCELAS
jgi:hypothetical protein